MDGEYMTPTARGCLSETKTGIFGIHGTMPADKYSMATIFTKIAKGEIPSYKVAENEDFYAFLDIAPMAKGHTLVIPKHTEEDYIFNLDDATYTGLCAFAKKVAQAIKAALPCKRVGVAVLGMEVPHTHIHLVPLQSEADMDFRKAKLELSPAEFSEIASAIYEEYVKIQ